MNQQWSEAIKKLGLTCCSSGNIAVCMLHFHPNDIIGRIKRLRQGAIPSLKTRPFDPLWQTRGDKSFEIQQLEEANQMNSIDPITCEPNNPLVVMDSPTHSIHDHDECQTTDNHLPNQTSQIGQYPHKYCDSIGIQFEDAEINNESTSTEHPEIPKKCHPNEEENRKLRTYSKLKSPRPVQASSEKLCDICFASMPQREFVLHLCLNQVNIECEYCVDATFTSMLALREHLSDTDHAQLVFYNCQKCAVAFPMRKLLQIHEKTNRTHFDEVSDDLGASAMEKIFSCRLCDFATSTAQELGSHVKACLSLQPKLLTFPKVQVSGPMNSPALFSLSSPPGQSKLPKIPRVRVRKRPQRFFECHICKGHLENRGEARQHLNRHVAARNTMCDFCRQHYTPNELRQWHICGTNDMQFQQISCEYCDETFQSLAKCMEHLATVHADDQTMYRCRKCARYFGMLKLRDFHEKYFPHRGLGSFKCKLCSNIFGLKSSLRKHMAHAHSVEAAVDRNFLCTECGKSLSSSTGLRNHALSHGERLIKCPDCPAKFHLKSTFKNHYQTHQNLKFKCNDCNCTCKTTIDLEDHIKRVHRKWKVIKNHECPFCDLKFKLPNRLTFHLRTHTKETPFGCEHCPGRFFRYKGDLTKHMQTHVGDNIYKCDVCGQGFRYHMDFKRHSFEHYREDKEKGVEATQRSSDTAHLE